MGVCVDPTRWPPETGIPADGQQGIGFILEEKHMRISVCVSLLLMAMSVHAADIVRYPLPDNSTFPISDAVQVPPGTTLIFQSGAGPSPLNPKAAEGTAAYWGDTKAQTLSTLANIKKSLDKEGLTFGDAVKMLAFLVGDPAKGGKMDFSGFMEGYTQYFGASAHQPNLPARSTIQVAGLASGALVEIEIVFAKQTAGK
jgi:enamine deaminase RidA (YjgF/YER057c/UK114 family)